MNILRAAGSVVLVAVLAGCGASSDGRSTAAPSESPSETVMEDGTPVPGDDTLVDICPQVEAALPNYLGYMKIGKLQRFVSRYADLLPGADLEARNALLLLRPSLGQYADALQQQNRAPNDSDSLVAILDADTAFLTALGSFADRCKFASSSALQ